MTRDTSKEAFEKIKSNGLLSKRRFEVYDLLYHFGPLTANETVRIALRTHPTANQASFNARFSELEVRNVIKQVGFKDDPISGNRTILWDVTSGLPTEPQKQITRKERIKLIKKLLDELEKDVNPLYRGRVNVIYNHVCKL
jgi:hypothetical protein